MIYEIRNYHFDPSRIKEYKTWLEQDCGPYLVKRMDIVGIWLGNEMETEFGGSVAWGEDVYPINNTWIIRWKTKEERERVRQEMFSDSEFADVLSKIPGGIESYLRTEVRFSEELLVNN